MILTKEEIDKLTSFKFKYLLKEYLNFDKNTYDVIKKDINIYKKKAALYNFIFKNKNKYIFYIYKPQRNELLKLNISTFITHKNYIDVLYFSLEIEKTELYIYNKSLFFKILKFFNKKLPPFQRVII